MSRVLDGDDCDGINLMIFVCIVGLSGVSRDVCCTKMWRRPHERGCAGVKRRVACGDAWAGLMLG
jgi:hypothetical protein